MKIIKLLVIIILTITYINSYGQVLNGEFKWEARIGENPGTYSPFIDQDCYDCDEFFDKTSNEARLLLHVRDNEQANEVINGYDFEDYDCSLSFPGNNVPGTDLCVTWEFSSDEYELSEIAFPGITWNFFGNQQTHARVGGMELLTATNHLIDNRLTSPAVQSNLIIQSRNFENDDEEGDRYDCNCTNGDQHLRFDSDILQFSGAGVNKLHKRILGMHAAPQGESVASAVVDVIYSYVHGRSESDPMEFGALQYNQTYTHLNNSFDPSGRVNNPHFTYEVTSFVNVTSLFNAQGFYYTFTVPADGASLSITDNLAINSSTLISIYDEECCGPDNYSQSSDVLASFMQSFNNLCSGTEYILRVQPSFEENPDHPFDPSKAIPRAVDLEINVLPTSGCLEDTDYTHNTDNFDVEFGVPDQTACATNVQPWMAFDDSFGEAEFNMLKTNVALQNYHVMEQGEEYLGGLFVDFQNVISSAKTVKIYHYRQRLGENTASDQHVLAPIPTDFENVVAGQQVYAHNYTFTPISGSAADAIVFEISSGDETDKIFIAAPLVVTGIDITSGIIGTTVRPDDIELIIYDPPGNGSYAGFEQDYTICREVTRSITGSEGNERDVKVKFGVKGEVGIIVAMDYEVSTSYNGSHTFSRDTSLTRSFNECTTISKSYTTSQESYDIGEQADLFIGNGEQWSWGYQDSIKIENCMIGSDTAFVVQVVPGTSFMWDKNQVDAAMVSLEEDIDDLANQNNPSDAVKLEKLQKEEQLRIWEEVLIEYEAKKIADINNPGTPFSWSTNGSGGGAFATNVTSSRTSEKAIFLEKKDGADFTATLGANGVEGGFRINMSKSVGSTITTDEGNTTTTTYTYNDTNSGDVHAGNWSRDPDYGTVIFHLGMGTTTSCPYESGIRRDLPSISASYCSAEGPFSKNVYIENADPGNPLPSERVYVKICNQNPNEDRLISWRIDSNNPQNLGYQFTGSNNQINDLGFIEDCQIYELVLEQINNREVYDNFSMRVYPTCLADSESLLLNESDAFNLFVTFNGPGNYPGINLDPCAPACPPDLDLTGTQSNNSDYASGGYISSDQVINSPAEVDYDATTEISLLQNFEVQAGAVFHAYINGCGN